MNIDIKPPGKKAGYYRRLRLLLRSCLISRTLSYQGYDIPHHLNPTKITRIQLGDLELLSKDYYLN